MPLADELARHSSDDLLVHWVQAISGVKSYQIIITVPGLRLDHCRECCRSRSLISSPSTRLCLSLLPTGLISLYLDGTRRTSLWFISVLDALARLVFDPNLALHPPRACATNVGAG